MLLAQLLERTITIGRLRLVDAGGVLHRFEGSPGPSVTVRLLDPGLHWKLVARPRLYLGEAYMDGKLTIEEGSLYDLIELLALYLAAECGADVTGLTLSVEQHNVATRRAAAAGLSDRVRFYLRDYREEVGYYDRIVSVGMFEHVGVNHYRGFFTKLKSLLAADGVALLHSIGRKDGPGSTSPWISKYIFPGGYIPALSEVLPLVERSRLWITDIEILRLHYAETLRLWRHRFERNRERLRRL